eukprot:3338250-Prorocentrum_lima.AAC.1
MTSSLVGSEMCIRDSFFPLLSLRYGGGRQVTNEGATTRKNAQDSESTVSYTHLTLPTICSV